MAQQIKLPEKSQNRERLSYSSLIYRLKHPGENPLTLEEFENLLHEIEKEDFQKVASEEEIEELICMIIKFAREGLKDPLEQELLEKDIKELHADENADGYKKGPYKSHFSAAVEFLDCKKESKFKKAWSKTGNFIKKHKKGIIIGVCVVAAVVVVAVVTVAVVNSVGTAVVAEAAAASTAAAGAAVATQNPSPAKQPEQEKPSSTMEPFKHKDELPTSLSDPFKVAEPESICLDAERPQENSSFEIDSPQFGISTDIFTKPKEKSFSEVYEAFVKEADLTTHLSIPKENTPSLDPHSPHLVALENKPFNQEVANHSTFLVDPRDLRFEKSIDFTPDFEPKVSQETPSDRLESTKNFIKGLGAGVVKGGKDSIVNLGQLGTELVKNPIQTADKIIDAFRDLSQLALTDQWGEICEAISPEVCQLAQEWNNLSLQEKGELIGYTLGSLGTDFIAMQQATKLAAEGVKGANKLLGISNNLAKIEIAAALEPALAREVPVIGKAHPINKNVATDILNNTLNLGHVLKMENSSQVIQLERQISQWLGEGTKLIKNKADDPIFLSKDGLRRVRFDFNNTSPHQNVHAHLDVKVNGIWEKSGQIYPLDVPHK